MKLKLFLFAVALSILVNTIDNARTRQKQRDLDQRIDGLYLLMWERDVVIMELKEELYNVNK